MRPVHLPPVPLDNAAKLQWCIDVITAISRASQVDAPVDVAADNAATYLAKSANLSDVASAATAFGNIKQAGTEAATGVLELATDAETTTGTDDTRATHPKGVKAAIDAAVSALRDGVSASFDTLAELAAGLATKLAIASNLSDVANAATAFGNIKQDATEGATGVLDKATDSEIRAGTTGAHAVCAEDIESASAVVALSESAGSIAVNWDSFINGEVTVDEDSVIANPSNGQIGTWRTILVKGSDATEREITFDTQFLGEVPTITDVSSSKWYLLLIYCVDTDHFAVSSKQVL